MSQEQATYSVSGTSLEQPAIAKAKQPGYAQRVVFVGGLMLCSVLAMPTEAHADIFGVLTSILTLISGPIGTSLSSVNAIDQDTQQLYQQAVYPLALVNSARGFISNTTNTYRAYMTNTFRLPLQSATLPAPQQLESLLRSRSATSISGIETSFPADFGAVPVVNSAAPQDRVLMDIDGAIGEDNLKASVISDQQQDTALQVADSIENQASVSAPGSAPFLTAQAQVANLRCQAYMHRMLAGELRQEAARIAHENALMKRRAELANSVTTQIAGGLSR